MNTAAYFTTYQFLQFPVQPDAMLVDNIDGQLHDKRTNELRVALFEINFILLIEKSQFWRMLRTCERIDAKSVLRYAKGRGWGGWSFTTSVFQGGYSA